MAVDVLLHFQTALLWLCVEGKKTCRRCNCKESGCEKVRCVFSLVLWWKLGYSSDSVVWGSNSPSPLNNVTMYKLSRRVAWRSGRKKTQEKPWTKLTGVQSQGFVPVYNKWLHRTKWWQIVMVFKQQQNKWGVSFDSQILDNRQPDAAARFIIKSIKHRGKSSAYTGNCLFVSPCDFGFQLKLLMSPLKQMKNLMAK